MGMIMCPCGGVGGPCRCGVAALSVPPRAPAQAVIKVSPPAVASELRSLLASYFVQSSSCEAPTLSPSYFRSMFPIFLRCVLGGERVNVVPVRGEGGEGDSKWLPLEYVALSSL